MPNKDNAPRCECGTKCAIDGAYWVCNEPLCRGYRLIVRPVDPSNDPLPLRAALGGR